jgi:hypothetical protein
MNLRVFAVVLACAVAGCAGGGGTSGSNPIGVPTAAPTATASTSPSTSPSKSPAVQTVNLRIVIPRPAKATSSRLHPQYVSSFSSSITVVINTVNGVAPPAYVTASTTTALVTSGPTPNCTLSGGTEICSVPVEAPPGTVNYTFTVTDGTNALSTLTSNETIAQGQVNGLTIVLEGIVHTVSLSVPTLNSQTTAGSYPEAVAVEAFDADGGLIVDPGAYANPFTLTDPETATSSATNLSDDGGSAGAAITISTPDDTVSLGYRGIAINSFAIAAGGSIPGGGTVACVTATACDVTAGTPNDITFAGTQLDVAANGGLVTDPNYGRQTVYFSQASGSAQISATEAGFTDPSFGGQFEVALDPMTCGSGASAVARVGPGGAPATTFTITAQNPGICLAKLSEFNWLGQSSGAGYPLTDPGHTPNATGLPTHDGAFYISVTSTGFGIDAGRR